MVHGLLSCPKHKRKKRGRSNMGSQSVAHRLIQLIIHVAVSKICQSPLIKFKSIIHSFRFVFLHSMIVAFVFNWVSKN